MSVIASQTHLHVLSNRTEPCVTTTQIIDNILSHFFLFFSIKRLQPDI